MIKISENENIINRKIAAAQALGLSVDRSYQKIGDSFFMIFEIKNGENVVKTFTLEINKKTQLSTYNQQISILQARISFIQEQINSIKAIK